MIYILILAVALLIIVAGCQRNTISNLKSALLNEESKYEDLKQRKKTELQELKDTKDEYENIFATSWGRNPSKPKDSIDQMPPKRVTKSIGIPTRKVDKKDPDLLETLVALEVLTRPSDSSSDTYRAPSRSDDYTDSYRANYGGSSSNSSSGYESGYESDSSSRSCGSSYSSSSSSDSSSSSSSCSGSSSSSD